MSYKSKFILFDYDGTIVNSEMAIITGIKYALEFYKYEIPSDKKAREKSEAIRRARKLSRKRAMREGLIPMKKQSSFRDF